MVGLRLFRALGYESSADKIFVARPASRPRNAHRSNGRVRILHSMDASHGTFSSCPLPMIKHPYVDSPQPFVDQGHPLQSYFPPRVWAIRIPVILILLGSAVVGSFLSIVMIRSNRKKAAKAKAAADKGKKKA